MLTGYPLENNQQAIKYLTIHDSDLDKKILEIYFHRPKNLRRMSRRNQNNYSQVMDTLNKLLGINEWLEVRTW